MSKTSEEINDTMQQWQALINDAFKGWETHFEAMFLGDQWMNMIDLENSTKRLDLSK